MPGGDRRPARRGILRGGAAVLASAALPFPAGASAASEPVGFASDIRLPGLLHAAIARPPLPGWRLAGFDAAPALHLHGVVGVVRLEPGCETGHVRLGGAAVLAHDTWSAQRGRDALRPVWEETAVIEGEPALGFFVPRTAEPLMEPPSATARFDRSGCTVWIRTPEPEQLRHSLGARLGLAIGAVNLHPTAPACGQAAANPAYAIEAALLSRAMDGAPVSLSWTVADDLPFRHRPALA